MIQKDFDTLDPVVGVNQKMRALGIPADVMTVDCLRSGKRILLILNDEHPDVLSYQKTFKEDDPGEVFQEIPLEQMSSRILYEWIKDYFAPEAQSHSLKN